MKLDNRGKPRLHGGRRLTRKEKGSWDTSDWAIEVQEDLHLILSVLLLSSKLGSYSRRGKAFYHEHDLVSLMAGS